MQEVTDLSRFVDAQANNYADALAEIRNGRKTSHWMWYVFPQLTGLGFSSTARFYGLNTLHEAVDYLNHPVLGPRLIDIATAMVHVDGKTANQILGSPDDMKLRSSMTLFSLVPNTNPVFQAVLDKYYNGAPDPKTLALLGEA
ncbi:DUF1810 domain-containing protein [Fibrivirga algicola]|uniref:DUF1810 domain-containing protein n=1 Tax=Fibrivirga algicola TaxID=2950420 RepID=A0ABX0QED9_9BACT|nr:DUF1810 domain-containing protein [Fibrivirga algicola]ARK09644.1 calpastatin [Fibrella sp. ES10-3-2-2]NID10531.1 DUF1810 domain-containing protein [Fibrivirga algicola]